jgi:hypothetical protein
MPSFVIRIKLQAMYRQYKLDRIRAIIMLNKQATLITQLPVRGQPVSFMLGIRTSALGRQQPYSRKGPG